MVAAALCYARDVPDVGAEQAFESSVSVDPGAILPEWNEPRPHGGRRRVDRHAVKDLERGRPRCMIAR